MNPMQSGYYILCTSPSVGLRRGCGISLSIRFSIQLALVAGFRRVFSLALLFFSTFVSIVCMFDSRHIGLLFLLYFLFPFLEIIIIIAFFHVVFIRFSVSHLVYSLGSVFKMVSSPDVNVLTLMYIRCVLVSHFSFLIMLFSPPTMLYLYLFSVRADYVV